MINLRVFSLSMLLLLVNNANIYAAEKGSLPKKPSPLFSIETTKEIAICVPLVCLSVAPAFVAKELFPSCFSNKKLILQFATFMVLCGLSTGMIVIIAKKLFPSYFSEKKSIDRLVDSISTAYINLFNS
ncbi:hypothetical protein KAH94_00995 [bacterium]|nr:hypothetical protein [bacterium]